MLRLSYLSKTGGVGCTIKQEPEHFIVEEIGLDGEIYEVDRFVQPKWKEKEDYTIVVVQKKNWTTHDVIRAITALLKMSKKRASFAGSKDRRAITVQCISIYNADVESVKKLKIKDVAILGAWYWDRPIHLGDLLGNRFTIYVPETVDQSELISNIYSELGGVVPNYFGEQRFGARWNSHLIGKYLIKRKFADAVHEYLTRITEEPAEVKEARLRLAQTYDYKTALKEFPQYLKYERILLNHLVTAPNDYIGALRRLPLALCLMFIHSYQAHLFNTILSDKISEGSIFDLESGEYRCGVNWYSFPDVMRINGKFPVGKIIGYETKINEREKRLLDEEGITPAEFKIPQFPELSSRGSYRPYLVPIKDFEFKKGTFVFELPPGSYATIVMREFLDKKGFK
jgi:tRNA pseudouridine13 synthase